MKLLFKQRLFSWFDSYDIYEDTGNKVYTVKGQLAWGYIYYQITGMGIWSRGMHYTEKRMR